MRAIALEYHDVVSGDFAASGFAGAAADSYKLRSEDFAAHLAALALPRAGVGVDVRSLGAARPAAPPVLFTFDDGGIGALEAATRLERHGWVGHFLVTTAQVGRPGFLSAGELRDLDRRGHVIGSHSHSHPVRMARLTHGEAREEWRRSIEILADILGHPVDVASVPGGYYRPFIAEAAGAGGIRWLFTSEPVTAVAVVGDCRVIGRFTLRRTTPAATALALTRPHGLARASQWAVWNAKKVAKTVAGDAYLRLRASLFRDRESPDVIAR